MSNREVDKIVQESDNITNAVTDYKNYYDKDAETMNTTISAADFSKYQNDEPIIKTQILGTGTWGYACSYSSDCLSSLSCCKNSYGVK